MRAARGLFVLAVGLAVCAACGTLQGTAGVSADDAGAQGDGGACARTAPFNAPTTLAWLDGDPRAMRIGEGGRIYAARVKPGETLVSLTGGAKPDASLVDDGFLARVNFAGANNEHPAPFLGGFSVVFESDNASTTQLWLATRISLDVAFNAKNKPISVFGPGIDASVVAEAKDPYKVPLDMNDRLYFTLKGALADGGETVDAIYAGDVDKSANQVPDVALQLEVTPPASVKRPVVSADELEIFFSYAPDGEKYGIYHATRSVASAPFAFDPTGRLDVSTDTKDEPTWLSANGCTLYVIVGPDGMKKLVELSR